MLLKFPYALSTNEKIKISIKFALSKIAPLARGRIFDVVACALNSKNPYSNGL